MLHGPLSSDRSPNEKGGKKKEKKEKNTIFVRESQPTEIVGVLYRMKMRRKGVFCWLTVRESVLSEWRGRRFRKKEKQ